MLHTFNDVIWHVSWSITGDILAVSGGDNKVCESHCVGSVILVHKLWLTELLEKQMQLPTKDYYISM